MKSDVALEDVGVGIFVGACQLGRRYAYEVAEFRDERREVCPLRCLALPLARYEGVDVRQVLLHCRRWRGSRHVSEQCERKRMNKEGQA